MPYTQKQCALFGAMTSGTAKGSPPKDWKAHCAGKKQARKAKHKKVKRSE